MACAKHSLFKYLDLDPLGSRKSSACITGPSQPRPSSLGNSSCAARLQHQKLLLLCTWSDNTGEPQDQILRTGSKAQD